MRQCCRLLTVLGDIHCVTFFSQAHLYETGYLPVVFDYQYPHESNPTHDVVIPG
jgi:hypothetical protein